MDHPSYLLRFDNVNDRIKRNSQINSQKNIHFKKISDREKLKEIMRSGINNLEYTIIERKMIDDIVELIKVNI